MVQAGPDAELSATGVWPLRRADDRVIFMQSGEIRKSASRSHGGLIETALSGDQIDTLLPSFDQDFSSRKGA